MRTIDLNSVSAREKQVYLQAAIGPRPICLASTVDRSGNVNLSPFSFFNLFSIDPPLCIFSPSRRVRDNTTKHTLDNIMEVPECVINIVNYDMVQQTSLASCEYPKGVNEFIKSGFTMEPSETIRPPRVAQSPVQLECVVRRVIPLGEIAGSGNLVVAEVVRMHLREEVMDERGIPDPLKLDLVARLGGDWYARITPESLFSVVKPEVKTGIGVDRLPRWVLASPHLTGNDLARLANVPEIPPAGQVSEPVMKILEDGGMPPGEKELLLADIISRYLEAGDIDLAWQVIHAREQC